MIELRLRLARLAHVDLPARLEGADEPGAVGPLLRHRRTSRTVRLDAPLPHLSRHRPMLPTADRLTGQVVEGSLGDLCAAVQGRVCRPRLPQRGDQDRHIRAGGGDEGSVLGLQGADGGEGLRGPGDLPRPFGRHLGSHLDHVQLREGQRGREGRNVVALRVRVVAGLGLFQRAAHGIGDVLGLLCAAVPEIDLHLEHRAVDDFAETRPPTLARCGRLVGGRVGGGGHAGCPFSGVVAFTAGVS